MSRYLVDELLLGHVWKATGEQELIGIRQPDGIEASPFDVYECARCGATLKRNPDYGEPEQGALPWLRRS